MIINNNDTDYINYDLNAIVEEANELRAAYLKETLSDASKKLINLFSAELPEFIPGPLAHR
ncbi:MAG: hypothetical protein GYB20_15415 [Oceanospirillales bacterium]|nr:hypothetical protein [Oceanospirillales bacterium]MBR9889069.1 hypothetical protein [Oceanospirillales bacterium]